LGESARDPIEKRASRVESRPEKKMARWQKVVDDKFAQLYISS
jgi:hypothetical protein